MSQIRAQMQRDEQFLQIDKEAQQYKKMLSNLSSVNNIEDDIQIFDNDEFIPNVSDTEIENDEESDNSLTGNMKITDNWRNIIASWVELIEDEVQDLEIENMVENFDITVANISQITHPVNDMQAKWNLCDIFTDNLEFPSYLESFIAGES